MEYRIKKHQAGKVLKKRLDKSVESTPSVGWDVPVNPWDLKTILELGRAIEPTHKFGTTDNKFKEFADVMKPIYTQALRLQNLPLTNLDNLVKQSALESDYGTQPVGEFNLGGIKNFTGDPAQGVVSPKDNISYLKFKNLQDFAKYKVDLLNRKYNAINAANTNDFINRLHGDNPTKQSYSADKKSYSRNLNDMPSLSKYLQ